MWAPILTASWYHKFHFNATLRDGLEIYVLGRPRFNFGLDFLRMLYSRSPHLPTHRSVHETQTAIDCINAPIQFTVTLFNLSLLRIIISGFHWFSPDSYSYMIHVKIQDIYTLPIKSWWNNNNVTTRVVLDNMLCEWNL